MATNGDCSTFVDNDDDDSCWSSKCGGWWIYCSNDLISSKGDDKGINVPVVVVANVVDVWLLYWNHCIFRFQKRVLLLLLRVLVVVVVSRVSSFLIRTIKEDSEEEEEEEEEDGMVAFRIKYAIVNPKGKPHVVKKSKPPWYTNKNKNFLGGRIMK